MPKADAPNKAWKDLLKACSQNNVEVVRYHLENNVDPNYQDPKYFTSPLFEAIHGGHWQVVSMLVDAGASLNGTEIRTGFTPLELALEERQHTIVDFLLDRLPKKQLGPIMTILVSGRMDKQFLQQLAATGHIVLIDDDTSDPGLVQDLQFATKNRKVRLTNMMSSDLRNVTHWIVREVDYMLQYMMDYAQLMKKLKRSLIITKRPPVSTQLFWLLLRNAKTTAVVEPTTWWDTVGDLKWSPKWQDTVWWILSTSDPVEGCLYNYQRKVIAEYNDENAPAQQGGWDGAFKKLVSCGNDDDAITEAQGCDVKFKQLATCGKVTEC
mmetsp:Transcript_5931/g.9878  ORF Transcript_5931/g.9878 Transcript_5931/m.9878 type:complete len:324 (-) Transcript_5931:183-1154(-)|eukprot:CAMPEP_0119014498 /NCGR_PEP_ID=MMETSP1176-20130426/9846_1 /TAXON_ID=265551 /ORGANISM="Synedropsis recta cf, Strain CCMP1620" /LENGTH=323 /DNA_ID=CAMNT_0006967687 /DNA_START=159 /DNA_END=1130 /DNA_ORIENTATION=+